MLRQTWRQSLKVGSRGEDVRYVQDMLTKAGYDPGPCDGIFGRRTDKAVKAFQKAQKLQVDGVVGPKTWAALSTPVVDTEGDAHGDSTRRGRSLHIGLNVVDNAAYGMPVPVLRGCENDARDMAALAGVQGFSQTTLLSPQGTSENVINAINEAAEDLVPGDIFLLTYSGHGSQMRDPSGEETDNLDETWVLFDRQLLDDELYALWGRFQPGVRILVISDSCHSGTVTRELQLAYQAFASVYQDTREVGFVLDTARALPIPSSRDMADWGPLQNSLHQIMPTVISELYGGTRSMVSTDEIDHHVELVLGQLNSAPSRGVEIEEPPVTRNLPAYIGQADADRRRSLYRQVKTPALRSAPTGAHVLLISGCQDNQLSLDGSRNGLFTQRLLETWNQGGFSGVGYPDLHRQILTLMPPQQTPNLFWATPTEPAFEQQRPFTI